MTDQGKERPSRDQAVAAGEIAGWPLITLETVDSTNDEVRRRLAAGESPPFAVCAGRQTAGRGRRGRAWASAAGNLYLSIGLDLAAAPAAGAAQISFVAALALYEALSAVTGAPERFSLKWPNDVMLDRCKMAGILLEATGRRAGVIDTMIVGIGVNLCAGPDPDSVAYRVATVLQAFGTAPTVPVMARALIAAFQTLYRRWVEGGFTVIRDLWLARAQGLGQPITVRLPDRTVDGLFEGLDRDGALQLRLPDGHLETFTAGDVFFGPATLSR